MNRLTACFVLLATGSLACPAQASQVTQGPYLLIAQSSTGQVAQIDMPTGQSEVVLGSRPNLYSPNELKFDSSGNLYAVVSGSLDVLRITPSGQTSVFLSAHGTINHLAPAINGIAFDPLGTMFIASATNVYRFDPNTSSLEPFGDISFTRHGGFVDIEIDAIGNVYAAASGRVVKFDPTGHGTILTSGLTGQVRDMALDGLGHLYVVTRSGDALHRIDLATGTRQLVASGPTIPNSDIRGVETDLENNVYVLNSKRVVSMWDQNGVGGDIVFEAAGRGLSGAIAFSPTAVPEPHALTLATSLLFSLFVGWRRRYFSCMPNPRTHWLAPFAMVVTKRVHPV